MHISSTLIEEKLYLFKSANKKNFDLEPWLHLLLIFPLAYYNLHDSSVHTVYWTPYADVTVGVSPRFLEQEETIATLLF